MSMSNKMRRQRRGGESRARSQAHRFDGHKMAVVVNHVHFQRAHHQDK